MPEDRRASMGSRIDLLEGSPIGTPAGAVRAVPIHRGAEGVITPARLSQNTSFASCKSAEATENGARNPTQREEEKKRKSAGSSPGGRKFVYLHKQSQKWEVRFDFAGKKPSMRFDTEEEANCASDIIQENLLQISHIPVEKDEKKQLVSEIKQAAREGVKRRMHGTAMSGNVCTDIMEVPSHTMAAPDGIKISEKLTRVDGVEHTDGIEAVPELTMSENVVAASNEKERDETVRRSTRSRKSVNYATESVEESDTTAISKTTYHPKPRAASLKPSSASKSETAETRKESPKRKRRGAYKGYSEVKEKNDVKWYVYFHYNKKMTAVKRFYAEEQAICSSKAVQAVLHQSSPTWKGSAEEAKVVDAAKAAGLEAVDRMMKRAGTIQQDEQKWKVTVKHQGKQHYIGLFDSESKATRGQLAALAKLVEISGGEGKSITNDDLVIARETAFEATKDEDIGLEQVARGGRKRKTSETASAEGNGVSTTRRRTAASGVAAQNQSETEDVLTKRTRSAAGTGSGAANHQKKKAHGLEDDACASKANRSGPMPAKLTATAPDVSGFTADLPPQPNTYEYEEESAWRFHNPPFPPQIGGVEPEDLSPLPPPPELPAFPCTDDCQWTYNNEKRVLLGNFRELNAEDEKFLLEMMERDDITVVSQGLGSGLDRELWNPKYIRERAGNEYYHKFRKFQRKESGGIVRYMEVDKCVAMRVRDYFRYLDVRKEKLLRHEAQTNQGPSATATGIEPGGELLSEGDDFSFTDDCGNEHSISNVLDVVLYMIDFDMVKLLPALHRDFASTFKLPGCLPGGKHCMMNAVNSGARPFCGPNLYLTPSNSFTHFHQDGHGTVDSGHYCLSGYNEVVMLRRLPERHKKHAIFLLKGGDRQGSGNAGASQYDGLYGLPHGDGMGNKPLWPDLVAIEECERMGYCPSVFVLKPGQLVHINKGRLHAFRKLGREPLPDTDCHFGLRNSVIKETGYDGTQDLCVSVAWDWMYRGVSSAGINREVVSILECAALNQSIGNQSLAIPELSLLQMAQTLMATRDSESSWITPSESANLATVPEPVSTSAILKGILPSMRFVIGQHIGAEKEAESNNDPTSISRRVSITPKPNSWENPDLFALDPYGNGDFFCKVCHKELSNVYMHCDGCEKILNKDFNICVDCHAERKHEIFVQMHPLNNKRHSTINHTGQFARFRQSKCPCKNGPVCKNCNYCAGCSCKCHRWFTLNYRFLSTEDEKRLLKRVEDTVGVFPARETMARLSWIGARAKPTDSLLLEETSTTAANGTLEAINASHQEEEHLTENVSEAAVLDDAPASRINSSANQSGDKFIAVDPAKEKELPNMSSNDGVRSVDVADQGSAHKNEGTGSAIETLANTAVAEISDEGSREGVVAPTSSMDDKEFSL